MAHPDAKLYGRIGGLTASARGTNTTEAARRAFLARFERQVDPDGTLPPAERSKRAEAAKRLHFTRMSMQARRTRKTAPAIVSPEAVQSEVRRGSVEDPAA